MTKYTDFGYEDKNNLDCYISNDLNTQATIGKYNPITNKWEIKKSKKEDLRLGTFNCLGLERFAKKTLLSKRLKYICLELESLNLDIICLQEVSKTVLDYFKNSPIIKKNFYISNYDVNWSFGGEQVCLILSKIKPLTSYLYYLKGEHYYGLCLLEYNSFVIGSIYLQAGSSASGLRNVKTYANCRSKQLNASINKIKSIAKSKQFFLLGDFNFDLDNHGLEYVTLKNYNFYDLYKDHNPNKDGFTEDTDKNSMRFNFKPFKKKVRYDAIISNKKVLINECHIFGDKPIFSITKSEFRDATGKDPEVMNGDKINWFLSDHFGVLCDITLI
jgi:hypothetical protein